jgi:DNA-binding NarL/FixJ family response regulator
VTIDFVQHHRAKSLFSPAEWMVVKQIAMGYTIPQIAARNSRSKRTIESQWESIKSKLGIEKKYGKSDLMWWLIEVGLVEFHFDRCE